MNNLASAFQLIWIHSLVKHLLSTYYVPAPVLRTWNTVVIKTILTLKSSA